MLNVLRLPFNHSCVANFNNVLFRTLIAWDMDYAATMVVRICALMDLLHQDPRHQGHHKLTGLRHQGRQSLRQQSLHQLPGLRQHPRPIWSALLLSCPSVALLMLSLIVGHQALRQDLISLIPLHHT